MSDRVVTRGKGLRGPVVQADWNPPFAYPGGWISSVRWECQSVAEAEALESWLASTPELNPREAFDLGEAIREAQR